jgi:hypothetical protein
MLHLQAQHDQAKANILAQILLGFVCEFGVEGRGGFGKRGRSKWKKYRTLGGGALGVLIFLQNIKPSSFGGTKKLYWRRVLGGLRGFI